MPSTPPFVDPTDNSLDTDQILQEALPLAGLIGLFVGLALIPFLFVFLLGDSSVFGMLLMVAVQFILAVGAGIVLMYIITRAMQLANE
ncbi:MAG: hypothetical protein SVG88_10460 [Halobacteriales archaeon]|nr:hypothetical protein [Halobacteriales archaeon]